MHEYRNTYSTTMASLDDQTKVRGISTTVAGTGSLLVGVGCRHVVGKFSGALEHLALRVRSVGVFNFLGHGSGLVDGVGDTDKIAPGNAVERVAGSADFTVDLVSSSDAVGRVSGLLHVNVWCRCSPGVVERVEDATMRPRVGRCVQAFVAETAGVDFAEEWQASVQMSVPGDAPDGDYRS